MTTDLEADLRREFDAASALNTLTFSPESVLRQGNRTIRRRRIIAGGSAAMAVALVATGASLFARPDDKPLPPPATQTTTTGIVKAQAGFIWGQVEVQFDRDTRVTPNVRFSGVANGGLRQEVGTSSTGKSGQRPDAVWRSGMVGGHPVTIGLVPNPEFGSRATLPTITFADGGTYGVGAEPLKDTGYSMFYVDYTGSSGGRKEPSRPSDIASIRWSGPTGIVDGIEGDHRLTGRTLAITKTLSIEVVTRPGDGGRVTVFGQVDLLRDSRGSAGFPLSVTTTDASGVAVMSGREPVVGKSAKGVDVLNEGLPVAAGILPPGASNVGAIHPSGYATSALVVQQHLPDGTVIFALKADPADPSAPGTHSIKAITWTNYDGTPGRKDVIQK